MSELALFASLPTNELVKAVQVFLEGKRKSFSAPPPRVEFNTTEEGLLLRYLETELLVERFVSATVRSQGKLCLLAEPLLEALKNPSSSTVTLQSEHEGLTLRTEDTQIRLPAQDLLTASPVFAEALEASLHTRDLVALLEAAVPSCEHNPEKFQQMGVNLEVEGEVFVAEAVSNPQSVRYSGALVTPVSEAWKAILPAYSMEVALPILRTLPEKATVLIRRQPGYESLISMEAPGLQLYFRRIKGKGRHFNSILEKPVRQTVTAEVQAVITAVQRVQGLQNGLRQITLEMKEDHLEVSSGSSLGESVTRIPAEAEGTGTPYTFDSRLLLGILRRIPTPSVQIKFRGPFIGASFTPVGREELLFFLVPSDTED